MKVKRYIGENAQDAMQKVKMDLGRDAIILNTRKIRRKGFIGFFMKPLIEVVATIDVQDNKEINPLARQKDSMDLRTKLSTQNKFTNELKKSIVNFKDSEETAIKNEVIEIRSMVSKLYESMNNEQIDNKLSDVVKVYIKKLEYNGVDNNIIRDIKKEIVEKLDDAQQQSDEIVKSEIHRILQNYINVCEDEVSQKVAIFVGPTGVGKTTTIAKLAANKVLNEKKSVGMITSDTYRIAAVEQLKTYCEIIGVPLSIIYSPNEFSDVINKYNDKDVILVDTAGRSHKDKYQLLELKSLIGTNDEYEVYLVMSATTKYSDCIEIVNSYSFLNDYKLLFTKLDETSSYGTILNVSYITKKPICYLTNGQSVPDDIEKAEVSKIIKCILGEKLYERSSR